MNSSRQDYIQAIYRLSRKKGYTNNKHIAEYLKISRASVSEMLRKLEKDALVRTENTRIFLSEEGQKRAKKILSDHRLWEYFLVHVLKMEGKSVHEQADLLEHVTGEELREALNAFLEYPTMSPTGKIIYKNMEE